MYVTRRAPFNLTALTEVCLSSRSSLNVEEDVSCHLTEIKFCSHLYCIALIDGAVTCHEESCGRRIPLIRRISVEDGGLSDGVGSLSAYRVCS